MERFVQIVVSVAALSFVSIATAAKPIVYPAKGQSAQQQKKDEGECHVWAKQSTGIDPAVVAQDGRDARRPLGSVRAVRLLHATIKSYAH
jgi:hypothetical protein